MLADNPFHNSQPHPGALEFLLPVQPLKDAKQISGVLHFKARSVVADKYNPLSGKHDLPYMDHGALPPNRILDGIRKKIDKHLLHQPGHVRNALRRGA